MRWRESEGLTTLPTCWKDAIGAFSYEIVITLSRPVVVDLVPPGVSSQRIFLLVVERRHTRQQEHERI